MDINKLKGSVPDAVIAQIPQIVEKFSINTPLRLSHFLAQASHESGDFKVVTENLNYSAAGLKKIFSKYFPGTLNESYAKQPEKIASRVYANRMGNRDEASKDGYKFRGRGFMQLTGHDNYKSFGTSIGVDLVATPDLVATKYPLLSAAWFWNTNGLNAIADKGNSEATITSVTKRINGGTIGLPDRISHFQKFFTLLS